MKVEIFTDGACSGNPGPGGFGALLRVAGTSHQKILSGGYRRTTNNRMELMAVITALECLKNAKMEVHIYTDSRYVADAIEKKWLYGWAKRGYTKVKNPDLWQRLFPLLQKYQPAFHWVKGHAGHAENELVDRLAVQGSQKKDLPEDAGYEKAAAPDGLF